MDKEDLIEMAENPELIPGIYNYCNRWCERCAFTSRCLQFQMQNKEDHDPGLKSPDEDNARFWDRVSESLSLAMEMIRDFAEREGIDLDALDMESCRTEHEKQREAVRSHDCSRMASAYSKKVDRWFDSCADVWAAKEAELQSLALLSVPGFDPHRESFEIRDAADVIRWYQHFIYVKTARALGGNLREVPQDSDGSAKIAMIAIDHSMSAWANLLEHFPKKYDEIFEILTHLLKLKKSIEAIYPNAMAFIRPGFDDIEIL